MQEEESRERAKPSVDTFMVHLHFFLTHSLESNQLFPICFFCFVCLFNQCVAVLCCLKYLLSVWTGTMDACRVIPQLSKLASCTKNSPQTPVSLQQDYGPRVSALRTGHGASRGQPCLSLGIQRKRTSPPGCQSGDSWAFPFSPRMHRGRLMV